MQESHVRSFLSTLDNAYARLRGRVIAASSEGIVEFEALEGEVHEHLAEVGRAAIGALLASAEPKGDVVKVDGVVHRRVGTHLHEYMTTCGPVSVARGLFRAVRNGPTVCPLELRCGILSWWTPKAARVAALAVAVGTPREAEKLLSDATLMRPSRSSLDRLPKGLNEIWEANRSKFEQDLRSATVVPADAVTVSAMIDGVLVPMRDGGAKAKKYDTFRKGKQAKGPAGRKEVGCAAISFYDVDGKRLSTVRFARMPEKGKVTLKQMVRAEIDAILRKRPDLRVVKVADGAPNNWPFLESLPGKYNIVDYFHAAEHLARALDVILGANSTARRTEFDRLRRVLKERPDGAEIVIADLQELAKKRGKRGPRVGLSYFTRHRDRMHYAEFVAQGLPIGSGVVEGACRTLVTERLKRSGMRWRDRGGQGILTLRGALQSERFDQTWALIASTCRAEVQAA